MKTCKLLVIFTILGFIIGAVIAVSSIPDKTTIEGTDKVNDVMDSTRIFMEDVRVDDVELIYFAGSYCIEIGDVACYVDNKTALDIMDVLEDHTVIKFDIIVNKYNQYQIIRN